VKDFLSGRSSEAKAPEASDEATRKVVAAELLAVMSPEDPPQTPPPDVKDSSRQGKKAAIPRPQEEDDAQPLNQSEQPVPSAPPEQERARQLFLDHGYFDEAVQNLRAAQLPAERAAAAQALGLVGNQRATAHLIAAMFDDNEEVRTAAEAAIKQIGEVTGSDVSADVSPQNESKDIAEPAQTESAVMNEADLTFKKFPRVGQMNTITIVDEIADEVSAAEVSAAEVPAADVDVQAESSLQREADPNVATTEIPTDSSSAALATSEEDELLLQEQALRQAVAEIEQRLPEVADALKKSENEIQWRTEREAKLRSAAAARRLKEEKQRTEALQKAELRRDQEREAVTVEQAARLQAETEAQSHANEETNLRLKAASIRLSAAELARQRAEMERAREEAAERARLAEAMRTRDEARSIHEAELKRLHEEEEELRRAIEGVVLQQTNVIGARDKASRDTEQLKEEQAAVEAAQRAEAERLLREAEHRNSEAQEQLRIELENFRVAGDLIAKRRAEVDAAREKADADAERLLQAQARMQAAEQARAQAELERSRLETEIKHQVETQLQLLEETRRRGQEEHERLQEEIRFGAEKEQQRLVELEALRTKAEAESSQRAEKEQQILSQIDSLRIADAETRRRTEDAEVRRRAAEDTYRLIAEKVQRVEAEAHARAKEEERMLEKLEAERRSVAVEAQLRAEQEKRIREEIEMFRRLEEEERPRIQEATLQLAQAESRMQERKERSRQQSGAAEPMTMAGESDVPSAAEARPSDWGTMSNETARISFDQANRAFAASRAKGSAPVEINVVDTDNTVTEETESSVVTPAITSYLNSVDPYKRAAAVAELARLGSPDAFSRIADCFDDHSLHVRNAAARALRNLEPARTVDLFNRALENASAERRRNIGAAISASGLAGEAIKNLASENREDTYNALSILFVMAKTGEVSPLVKALEEHGTDDIGKAVSKLLSLSGYNSGNQTADDTTQE